MYGGRYLRRDVEQQIRYKNPIRNAVFFGWSDDGTGRAQVKIQGSNKIIWAWCTEFSRKEMGTLKPGDAVQITHPLGNVGRIEVISRGLIIPTCNGLTLKPSDPSGADAMLTGMKLMVTPNEATMRIIVRMGTYRLNGVLYSTAGQAMDNSLTWEMGEGGTFGDVAAVFDLTSNVPSAGNFRYVGFEVGSDGVIHKVVASQATADPPVPVAQASHLLLPQAVLLYGGMGTLSQSDVARPYEEPYPASLYITCNKEEMHWMVDLSAVFSVQVKNQYGWVMAGSDIDSGGAYVTMKFLTGNGSISSNEEGSSRTGPIGTHISGMFTTAPFVYTRDMLDPGDITPMFEFTLHIQNSLSGYKGVFLLDQTEQVMPHG